MSARTTMNGKPVLTRPAKTVLNMQSGFKPKLLCDGPTFSMGDACAFSCSFCYVPDMMRKAAWMPKDKPHDQIVVRREHAVEVLRKQLHGIKPAIREQKLVIYSSPLVDCAANMELVRETVEACKIIVDMTNWDIRLLSKSNLLPKVALGLAETDPGNMQTGYPSRVIYGVSTGTLDDKLAAAFEVGCAKVSKRIESLHWLQDNGFRTYGMICPSLPQKDIHKWAWEMAQAIRVDKCEHVWAEVMNVRGTNIAATTACLRAAGYEWEAHALEAAAQDKDVWEQYARDTFMAHIGTDCYGVNQGQPPKLRYLQYVNKTTAQWWSFYTDCGAVLL